MTLTTELGRGWWTHRIENNIAVSRDESPSQV